MKESVLQKERLVNIFNGNGIFTCAGSKCLKTYRAALKDISDRSKETSVYGIKTDTVELICEAINGVSFSKNRTKAPSTIEGQIVQDADRLDALGAIGIARTFAFGGEHGRSIESTIEHFHQKLLLLKDGMNTPAAKAIAQERHAFLEEFLRRYESEENLTD
jgi:HD superfamily phosphodiesterase